MGVGHELNGDDVAGLLVVRALESRLAAQDRLFVLDAGAAPENQTGALRVFKPDLVLMVDAAQMNESPGTVRWLDWRDTTGISASTHTLPPYMLATFITAEFGCEMALIGIQPASNLVDSPVSPVVSQAVADIVDELTGTLC